MSNKNININIYDLLGELFFLQQQQQKLQLVN